MVDAEDCVFESLFGDLAKHLPNRARFLVLEFALFKHSIFSPRFGLRIPLPHYASHLAGYLYEWEGAIRSSFDAKTAVALIIRPICSMQPGPDDAALMIRWAEQLPKSHVHSLPKIGQTVRPNYHYIFGKTFPLQEDAEFVDKSWLRIKLFGMTGLMATLYSPLYDRLTRRHQGSSRILNEFTAGVRLVTGPNSLQMEPFSSVQATFYYVYEVIVEQLDLDDMARLREF